jgi:hypothetical protein
VQWRQYLKLFAQSREGVDAPNEVAPFFFFLIQHTLWRDVLLTISRLTGPMQSAGHRNVSIRWLPRLTLTQDEEFSRQFGGLIDARSPKWEFAHEWRNKKLAHLDLDVALERAAPLTPASQRDVEEALAALREVLNRFSGKFFDSDLSFEPPEPGDADSLLLILRLGLEAERARDERLREGRSLPDDLK